MLIYKDILTGDEMFSDAYPVKLVDDMYYEVEGKSITISNDIDSALLGGNAASEPGEEEEGVDASSVTGINIVLSHRLQETSFDAKAYTTYIKDYMKAVKAKLSEKNPARVEKFMAGIQPVVKMVLGGIKEGKFNFYTGESMNPEGMVGLLNYREDGVTPYFVFFKDGLEEEKC
eukprot:m.221311 g.221311  ORF g.221311 m.221311 type:complete len:174 (+) comp15768_c0_seq1:175-696(+)